MKKIALALAGTVLFSSAFAQRIGVHAAGLFASQSASFSGLSISTGSRFGWKAGLVGELKLPAGIGIMPQLNIVSKGSKSTLAFAGTATESKTQLTYVEVPVLLTYRLPVGLFFGAGPSFSFGLSGKETLTAGGQSETYNVKFDGDEDANDDNSHYKRTDVGGQLLAGFHLPKGFFVNAHYSFGFSNVAPGNGEDGRVKNRYFGFGIGKMFGK